MIEIVIQFPVRCWVSFITKKAKAEYQDGIIPYRHMVLGGNWIRCQKPPVLFYSILYTLIILPAPLLAILPSLSLNEQERGRIIWLT